MRTVRVFKRASKAGVRTLFSLWQAGSLALSPLLFIEGYSSVTSKKVETQEQLERLVNEEKVKLGCNLEIEPTLSSDTNAYSSRRSDQLTYQLVVGGEAANEGFVKHEMYHICDGHFQGRTNPILRGVMYLFWAEPQAALYQAFDLRL